MAGSGSQLGKTVEQFVELFSKFTHPNFGICIDTAHIWGAGYSPREFWDELAAAGLAEKVFMIHLNNTSSKKGSFKERHVPLKEGEIPFEELQAFGANMFAFGYPVIEEQASTAEVAATVTVLREAINLV
jgi:deoxyribonuclease-4